MIDNKEYARQLRKNAVKDENGVIRVSPELWEEIARIIENSEEAKHGEWEQGDFYDIGDVCSICGHESFREPCKWNYCPNCGARMDGERK